MEIEKFTDSQVGAILSHVNRISTSDRNEDIDPERLCLDYSLTPYIDIGREEYQTGKAVRAEVKRREIARYRERLGQLYRYPRDDVKTLCGICVTMPRELLGYPEKQSRFFSGMVDGLSERYGRENVVSATVHYDERQIVDGKIKDVVDAGPGDFVGHLHFTFIPVAKIDKANLMEKKNHVKAMEFFDEKVSAKEVMTKLELQRLHGDMQAYLDSRDIDGRILLKGGSLGSINIPVDKLKEYTDRTGKVIDKDLIKDLTVDKLARALERDRERERSLDRLRIRERER